MMYRSVLRPLLFLLSAETAHKLASIILRVTSLIPGCGLLIRRSFTISHPSLRREVLGLNFESPVGVAAGFDKHVRLYNVLSWLGFSHVEIGTVTPEGQKGNPRPRLFRLRADKSLINRMGFNNDGVAIAVERLKSRRPKTIIGGNIGKNTATTNDDAVEDYLTTFRELFDVVDYFVINVSCPNITDMTELQDRDKLQRILRAVMEANQAKAVPKPVLVKVSPDLNDQQLDDVITLVMEEGLSGVVATNTTVSRENISVPFERIREIGSGGLSGQALRDRSTEVIRYIAEKSGKAFPIIGVGGIMNEEDALEKLRAGADLLQVYTGFIYEGPGLAKRINKAILRAGL